MIQNMHKLMLKGCSPVPLANYLKALGVFRLVAEQIDPDARGYWRDENFILESKLDVEELITFFINDYRPTPIVVPWSGNDFFAVDLRKRFEEGSDRFDKPPTSEKVIEVVLRTRSDRFKLYRQTICNVFSAMKLSKTLTKKDLEGTGTAQKRQKAEFIQAVRNSVPDESIYWIDATTVINEEPWFNNLLGSGGGNDGNSHFSDNFMQSLWIVLPDFENQKSNAQKAVGGRTFDSKIALYGSLFGQTEQGMQIPKMSQVLFNPAGVGAANSVSGFEADPSSNPWDFILLIEGSLLFAGGLAKKLGSATPRMASFPFLLGATPVGDIAVDDIEGTGKEIWLPLWDRPTSICEIRELFTSGRIEAHHRIAVKGIDAVQAISQLGVDRGVRAFRRIGLFKGRTGGDKYLSAIDMGAFPVRRCHKVDLLSDIDIWLSNLRNKAASKNAPTSIGRSLRNLERAIFSMSTDHVSARVQDVLISLGACEKTISKSFRWAKESFVRPIPVLSERWLREADDGSPEFRLAASLASVYGHYSDHSKPMVVSIRSQMEPVHTWLNEGHLDVAFDEDQNRDVIWSDGNPLTAMNRIMARRIMRAVQSGSRLYPDHGWVNSDLGDIADFIEGRIDLRHMVDLLWGLILVDWPSVSWDAITKRQVSDSISPGANYGVLKLCFAGENVRGGEIPIVPEIQRRAALGDSYNAVRLAEHRLRGNGLPTTLRSIGISPRLMERTAAALLFPIGRYQVDALADNVLRPDQEKSVNKVVNECE